VCRLNERHERVWNVRLYALNERIVNVGLNVIVDETA